MQAEQPDGAMSDTSPEMSSTPVQERTSFMSDEEWLRLIDRADSLVTEMEQLPVPEMKEKVFELLSAVDQIHREPLWRLVRLFKEGVLEKVIEDLPIRTLMELYDLLPPAEKSPGKTKPGGPSVYFPDIPVRVVHEPPPAAGQEPPHWLPAPARWDELASGEVRELIVDGRPVLLCRNSDEIYALESRCCVDRSSLGAAALQEFTLTCPSHPGCQYDIRRGERIDASGRIACYPVSIRQDGRVLLGFGMEPGT